MNRNRESEPLDPAHPTLAPTRPLFIDNRDGNALDRAIADQLRTRCLD